MKITKRKQKRLTIVVVLGIALLSVGVVAYFYINQQRTSQSQTTDEGSTSKPADSAPEVLSGFDADRKKKYVEESAKTKETPVTNSDKPIAKISVTTSTASDSVVVQTKLTAITDGICTITVNNSQESYTETVDVIYQPTFSTCKGFSVPRADLGNGSWNIVVQATSLDSTSARTVKTIQVN